MKELWLHSEIFVLCDFAVSRPHGPYPIPSEERRVPVCRDYAELPMMTSKARISHKMDPEK
jgi:hypothetical protein